MKEIIIVGAGDLGKEAVWLIEDINKQKPTYLILGFLDDDKEKIGKEFCGYKVLGTTEELEGLGTTSQVMAVIAIQDGSIRKEIVDSHTKFQFWETLIHPTAVMASSARLGRGSLVFPHVTISVDNNLGVFGLYYLNATICNNCVIGDYVSLMTGASVSEHVIIGAESYLSARSSVYPHKVLGYRVKVAAGVTITKDYGNEVTIGEKNRAFFLFK